jgi:uncharacterized protein (DUF1684 family)
MKRFTQFYFIGIVLVLAFILLYTFSARDKKDEYAARLIEEREAKDRLFRNSDNSPIPDRTHFTQLSYFPPNPSYRLKARLERLPDTAFLQVRRTDGSKERMRKFAYAHFRFLQQHHSLLLLQSAGEPGVLHLLFTDKTSGLSTYEGGRYLDLSYQEGRSELMLDFNLAYNPYCVYNANYSCPIPPPQNRLEVPIEAGEKAYQKAKP